MTSLQPNSPSKRKRFSTLKRFLLIKTIPPSTEEPTNTDTSDQFHIDSANTTTDSYISITMAPPTSLDSRQRQSKRDDAIRKRIENDLRKKKASTSLSTRRSRGAPGTVLWLKPGEPIICKPTATVYEVAQLMTARRENCVLVVNEIGELLGIFTAKDVAFRIVGSGLNATQVTIDTIMTKPNLCQRR